MIFDTRRLAFGEMGKTEQQLGVVRTNDTQKRNLSSIFPR
jgi:hypothetical protein